MNKKSAGFVIGAVAGAIAYYLRQRDQRDVDLSVKLGLKANIDLDERCGITLQPEYKELPWQKKVTWHITNNCPDRKRVSLENWRHEDGSPASPAAHGEGMPGLWTFVDGHGGTATIKGKIRFGFYEKLLYDIYIDNEPAVDPIVKLVL